MQDEAVKFAWMNGQFMPWEDTKVHVVSSCVIEGSSVFEGVRAYWSESRGELYLFKADEHLRRLYQSARIMRMSPGYTASQLKSVCVQLLRRNNYREDVHLRPAIYFGVGQHIFAHAPDKIDTGVYVVAAPRKSQLGSGSGLHVCVSSWRRISDADSPPRIKIAANYHNGRLAATQAAVDGYDGAILLDDRGKIAEGPAACVFLVRDGVAITPPVTSGILESITRSTVIELLEGELSVPVVEREVDRTELYVADEIFLCGTAMEVIPVLSADRYVVSDGKVGDLTDRIQHFYERIVRGEDPRYKDSLLPVYASEGVSEALESDA